VPVFALAFVWLIGALLMLTVPGSFHSADVVVGVVAAIGVAWYGAALHWRVRAGRAGVEALAATEESAQRATAGPASAVTPNAVAVDGRDGE
jgi:hypothetical protein